MIKLCVPTVKQEREEGFGSTLQVANVSLRKEASYLDAKIWNNIFIFLLK